MSLKFDRRGLLVAGSTSVIAKSFSDLPAPRFREKTIGTVRVKPELANVKASASIPSAQL